MNEMYYNNQQPFNHVYAYARVSSSDQNEARQIAAFEQLGIPKEHIYLDKMSGKNFDRPAYRKLLRKLKKGSILYLKSLDRLGRNYEQILKEWRHINQEIGADIVILDMPLLDTRSHKDLIGTLISDIIIALLSYVAQTEREMIHARQAEGILEAKKRGVKFGRPPAVLPANFSAIYFKWKRKKITANTAASLCKCSRSTFYSFVKTYENSLTVKLSQKAE